MFGYVFRNRYRSEAIYAEIYLKQCIIYIHNNPVKAGICKEPSSYIYSSYNEILENKSLLISINSIHNLFDSLENFKNSHKKIKLNSYLEIEEDKNLYIEDEIVKFFNDNKIDTGNIKEKYEVLKPFIQELLNKKIISKRELCERLKITYYTISKLNES